MRKWSRSPFGFACGACASIYSPGTPVQSLYLPGIKEPKLRCSQCAGEPVPDLPAFVPKPAIALTAFDEDGIERPIKAPKRQPERFAWEKSV